ncbi:MAG: SDR family NAD(P)-dependent oxidoreductase [Planctomycetaceae bacterium]
MRRGGGRGASVALLTGAAHGIGRATAGALAARGFRLGLIDRDERALADLAGAMDREGVGASIAAEPADVSDGPALATAVGRIERRVGPTDVLVACAGVGRLASAVDLDLEGFRQMLEVNVLGVARSIEAVLPGMVARRAGHLVGISSVAGYRGLPWMPGYSASKAALATYLEGLRPVLKRRGVTITTVYPGFVRTAMTAETPFRRPVPMLEPAQAAQYLVRAVVRRPRDLVFPPSTALGMGLLRRLPTALFDWLMDRAGPRVLTSEF